VVQGSVLASGHTMLNTQVLVQGFVTRFSFQMLFGRFIGFIGEKPEDSF
jgi:hypothetical protein